MYLVLPAAPWEVPGRVPGASLGRSEASLGFMFLPATTLSGMLDKSHVCFCDLSLPTHIIGTAAGQGGLRPPNCKQYLEQIAVYWERVAEMNRPQGLTRCWAVGLANLRGSDMLLSELALKQRRSPPQHPQFWAQQGLNGKAQHGPKGRGH